MVAWGWGKEGEKDIIKGHKESFKSDGNVCILIIKMGHRCIYIPQNSSNCTHYTQFSVFQ